MAVIVSQLTDIEIKKGFKEETQKAWEIHSWKADITFPSGETVRKAACKSFGSFPIQVAGATYTVEDAKREEYTAKNGVTYVSYAVKYGKSGPRPHGETPEPVPGYVATTQTQAAAKNARSKPTFEEAVGWMISCNEAFGVENTPQQSTTIWMSIRDGQVQPPPSTVTRTVLETLGGRVVESDEEIPF